MIEVKNLSVIYGSKKHGFTTALDNVSVRWPSAQTHVLLGSSGSGKSTLLKCLMGLVRANSGEMKVFGEVKSADLVTTDFLRQLGYVPQDSGLFPNMTLEQNIQLVARLEGWTSLRLQTRTRELIELVGLDPELMVKYPKQISGGQRQRVALMRALFLDPKVLLLDEPLGALDPLMRVRLQNDLKTIFNRVKKTVLIVTHDLNEAAYFGHTITLFHEGHLIQHGRFDELLKSPVTPFVTEFIEAQRSFLDIQAEVAR